ncbi:hypothetical protein SCHPADRAFT_864278 [Schizopora paradoxa]|uniref:Uncharacterized protein n=1 Tax=Schizopora paradoxa TaxID=27342 RepID=A0A0H2ST22_9AGAM|nr:hypothetical protein SCHPADRAFT_864278 [Schizopora paradoxa]
MIAGLSKAVTLYLAPLLSLTALLLSLFAFISPVLVFSNQVSLLSVTPSTSLTQPGGSSKVDGPTVRLGALGSCSRPNNDSPLNCTSAVLNPVYDLSVLPNNAPNLLLSAPTSATPAFIAISLVLSTFFVLLFSLLSFRSKLPGKMGAVFDKPAIHSGVAWFGVFGFMTGLTSFLILRIWFGKSVDDFNIALLQSGSDAPDLVASVGSGFTLAWVAYAFLAVPIVASLAKLHVAAGGK